MLFVLKKGLRQAILEEGTVEVKATVEQTIQRLEEMELTAASGDTHPLPMCCICDRKGRICVTRYSASRGLTDDMAYADDLSFRLQGQVYSEEGRTLVHYQVVHSRGTRLGMTILLGLFAALAVTALALVAFSLFSGARITTVKDKEFLLAVGMGLLSLLVTLLTRRGHRVPPNAPPPQLKAFFLRRLEAVERWEE